MPKNYSSPTSSKLIDRMRKNSVLTWLSDMIKMSMTSEIIIPTTYRESVLETKKLLEQDTSGLVSSVLDFAIDASLVEFKIETSNKNLAKKLNGWLGNVNADLRGTVPVGIKALAKEYFRERWKGSSFLVLKTTWEEKEGFHFPTSLFFLDGEDIVVKSDPEKVSLDGKEYWLRITDDKKKWKILTDSEDIKYFIQKPYSSWGKDYTIPFLIQRGIYKNLKFLDLLEKKGEFVVGKALEYLLVLKKGTENMALTGQPDFIYSKKDLEKVKDDFIAFAGNRKGGGTSAYTTNFDTEIEHLIPEYARALKQELYTPIERRLLAGLGLIDVLQGIASTRKESMMNPKPFFSEIKTAIDDFKLILLDIVHIIIEKNKISHKKYFSSDIKIKSTMVKEALTENLISQLRSGYDRGIISKRTYGEILGIDLDIEIERRKLEKETEEVTYPPIIQNQENIQDETTTKKEDVPEDKKGLEKKNFTKMNLENAKIVKEKDGWHVLSEDNKNLGGPYKTRKEAVKRLQQVEHFKHKGEDLSLIKGKKNFEIALKTMNLDELIEIKKLEVLGKHSKILDKFIKANEEKE